MYFCVLSIHDIIHHIFSSIFLYDCMSTTVYVLFILVLMAKETNIKKTVCVKRKIEQTHIHCIHISLYVTLHYGSYLRYFSVFLFQSICFAIFFHLIHPEKLTFILPTLIVNTRYVCMRACDREKSNHGIAHIILC